MTAKSTSANLPAPRPRKPYLDSPAIPDLTADFLRAQRAQYVSPCYRQQPRRRAKGRGR